MKAVITDDQRQEMISYVINRVRSLGMHDPQLTTVPLDTDIRVVLDCTLREIYQSFGTQEQFASWVKSMKEVEYIHVKRLDAAIKEGKLVSREAVKAGVIDPIEASFVQLLRDGSQRIAIGVRDMVRTNKPDAELQAFVRNEMSQYIRSLKVRVRRGLKKL